MSTIQELPQLRVLITGGAGFIGSNLANKLLDKGHEVTVFDNLSRAQTEKNLAWLQENHGARLQIAGGDIRDPDSVHQAVNGVDVIYHLAGQAAVTTSVLHPREDFEINLLGTLNVLEAARASTHTPIVVFTSTNKVYGEMQDVAVVEQESRYEYEDRPYGILEEQPLDFHSPYGCSKGSADQYVRDYARMYGLRTVVFRMSCIYGARQFGNEDQGWLAHFMISAVTRRPITIYGNGKQVRDVLYVDDLISAFERAVQRIEVASGKIYNIGGGPDNTISVWAEFQDLLRDVVEQQIEVRYSESRPGDQRVYVSDIRKAKRDLNWEPRVSPLEGATLLQDWVSGNRDLFEKIQARPVTR